MTCCLAVSLPNCSIAAADTRIGVQADGRLLFQDGPGDFTLEVAALGRSVVLPYEYRKIRRIGDGWVVCAGDFATAREVLDRLQNREAILFTHARALFSDHSGLIEAAAAATGIPRDTLGEGVVYGAPFGSAAQAWTLGLRPNDGRTHRRVPYAINWPHSVPLAERARASGEFSKALARANQDPSALAYAKALALIIDTAARHAPDAGPFIQAGLTMVLQGVKKRVYFQGLTLDLLAMTEAEFQSLAQPV